ncbi:MAG: heparinase II/III family protein, partial [bacterium]
QKPRRARREALCSLVLAECAEGKGRFIDDIVNGIWLICEESYWGVPAHLSLQAQGFGLPDVSEPTVDLFASETGSLLAWTSYLLGSELDKVSPLLQPRIQLELEKRIITPCLERDDFWWMGFRPGILVNNWNPWVNSNWLTVVLLMEKNERKRITAVEKILRSLDVFIDSYPPDGGCDEGPGYWNRAGASLFDCLELLYHGTRGEINIYDEPLIREIGRYIYRAHIADRYFINFADASATVTLESDLAYRYGKRIGDERLAAFGAYFADLQREDNQIFRGSIGRQLPAIFNFSELSSAEKALPLLRDVWMEGNQVMAARSQEGSVMGLYVAAKGGHNDESHNHNDIGNFIVYLDGHPMIIDVGVETYTKKTFSAQRYEIWTMQSAYHNLPTINDIMQKNGRQFTAREVRYTSDDSFAQLRLDMAGAYPPEADINKWIRTVRLNRGKDILVTDAFDLNKEAQEIELNLMTSCQVTLDEPGQLILQDKSGIT